MVQSEESLEWLCYCYWPNNELLFCLVVSLLRFMLSCCTLGYSTFNLGIREPSVAVDYLFSLYGTIYVYDYRLVLMCSWDLAEHFELYSFWLI